MAFKCPVCQREVDESAATRHVGTEARLINFIRMKHPDWVESDGICIRCLEETRKMVEALSPNTISEKRR